MWRVCKNLPPHIACKVRSGSHRTPHPRTSYQGARHMPWLSTPIQLRPSSATDAEFRRRFLQYVHYTDTSLLPWFLRTRALLLHSFAHFHCHLASPHYCLGAPRNISRRLLQHTDGNVQHQQRAALGSVIACPETSADAGHYKTCSPARAVVHDGEQGEPPPTTHMYSPGDRKNNLALVTYTVYAQRVYCTHTGGSNVIHW